MGSNELSGTASGPGFGNKTDDADPDLSHHHANTRYDIAHTNAYSGGHETYGSGATSGPGSGNKLDAAGGGTDLAEQHSNTRYDKASDSQSYQGGTQYGSGTTAGVGAGNKTVGPETDSTSGKLMEKVGGMMGKDDMVEKGKQKRDAVSQS